MRGSAPGLKAPPPTDPASAEKPTAEWGLVRNPRRRSLHCAGHKPNTPFHRWRITCRPFVPTWASWRLLPLTGWLVIEPGFGYMKYPSQGGSRTSLWFPEVQLQAELPLRAVRPYLGIGAGAALISAEGQRATELTFSSAAGVR